MYDETQSQDESIEPEETIVTFPQHRLDEDDLFVLRVEAEREGHSDMAGRIEIERTNVLMYEGYSPKFTHSELISIGIMMASAKKTRASAGHTTLVTHLKQIASTVDDMLDDDSGE